jgi:hypothetical protein
MSAPKSVRSAMVTLYVEKFHRHYSIFRSGGDLYQSDYEIGANGKDVFRDTQKIVQRPFLYGAGDRL